jgi:hypothetical protein
MDLNLALADAVEAMYPGNTAAAGEQSLTSDALPGVRLARMKDRLDECPSRRLLSSSSSSSSSRQARESLERGGG